MMAIGKAANRRVGVVTLGAVIGKNDTTNVGFSQRPSYVVGSAALRVHGVLLRLIFALPSESGRILTAGFEDAEGRDW